MKKVPLKSGNVLVTQKMLSNVKSELKSDITSVSLEVRSLRSEMNAKFLESDAKLEKVIAAVYRTNALVEEQNSRNRVVLDGYDQIYRRQEEYEKRLKSLEG